MFAAIITKAIIIGIQKTKAVHSINHTIFFKWYLNIVDIIKDIKFLDCESFYQNISTVFYFI